LLNSVLKNFVFYNILLTYLLDLKIYLWLIFIYVVNIHLYILAIEYWLILQNQGSELLHGHQKYLEATMNSGNNILYFIV